MTSPVRLVSMLPSSTLRNAALASYRAARLSAARSANGSQESIRLNALSMAGLLLATFDDAELAVASVEGSDDFAARVRLYLRDVLAQERR